VISNGGPSPYSFGLVQQHNNLIGNSIQNNQGNHMMTGQLVGAVAGKRTNSQKPSSAPSKNRIRSQSPINVEGQTSGHQINQTTYHQNQMQATKKSMV